MKKFMIYYKNGNPPCPITVGDVSKEENGWIIWNGLAAGLTFLSNKYIDRIEEVKDNA